LARSFRTVSQSPHGKIETPFLGTPIRASFPRFLPESQDDFLFPNDDTYEGVMSSKFFGNSATTTNPRREIVESSVGNPLPIAHRSSLPGFGSLVLARDVIEMNRKAPKLPLGSFGAKSLPDDPANKTDHGQTFTSIARKSARNPPASMARFRSPAKRPLGRFRNFD
jgi:hypothetical protein